MKKSEKPTQKRSIEQISNDFAENMPLTKAELVRLVAYERQRAEKSHAKLMGMRQNAIDTIIDLWNKIRVG